MRLHIKIIVLLLLIGSCINPYDLTQENADSTLVVDGYISDSDGHSEIKLQWSGAFQATIFDEISNAKVVIIENETIEHNFVHQANGTYKPVHENFSANAESSYRLKIALNGQEYESDQVSVPSSLGIDSISYIPSVVDSDGSLHDNPVLKLNVTTGFDENASKYYLYTFEETWKTLAPYSTDKIIQSTFIYDKDHNPINLEFETIFEGNTTHCWAYKKTETQKILTTERFARNQFINQPVFNIDLSSSRLLYKYSVLVNQYAVTKEVNHFLEMLTEFSENTGFLYDTQPGYIEGNMHNKNNPDEKVIGIFYAASHRSSRIFIENSDLPNTAKQYVSRFNLSCNAQNYGGGVPIGIEEPIPDLPITNIPNDTLTEHLFYVRDTLISEEGFTIYDHNVCFDRFGDPYLEIFLTYRSCIDCRTSGSNVKPEWWE